MKSWIQNAGAAIAVLAAACGGAKTAPVNGATEAFHRHYQVTVADADAAVARILAEHYKSIVSDDGRHVVAESVCRTERGNPCVNASSPDHPDRQAAGTIGGSAITVEDYNFQVHAGVVGGDGDVQIQLGGHAKRLHEDAPREVQAGDRDAPGWMPHEIDLVRLDIDKLLRH